MVSLAIEIEQKPHANERPRPVRALTIYRRDLAYVASDQLSLELEAPLPQRPRTRGECADVPRPCPFVSCVHHLYLDVTESGSIRLNFPDLEPHQLPADSSCSLDVAERGGVALQDISPLLNLTREGVRQTEVRALDKLGRIHLRVLSGLR